jgi:RND family efflux transporter MFP subunit
LLGLSGVARFDAQSGYVSLMQDALDEAAIHERRTAWIAGETQPQVASCAHQRLLQMTGGSVVVSRPIVDGRGRLIGVVLALDGDQSRCDTSFDQIAPPLASLLSRWNADRQGVLTRMQRRVAQILVGTRSRAILLVAAALCGLLVVPVPYHVKCACQIQPVTRRFVVAPYDGTLEKCLVQPGDLVRSGDVLARMDERELRWELAGLRAELARAEKERDTAMAGHKTAAAQTAELEVRRLNLQRELLQHRVDNLSIRSPLDGMIVAGDLEKAEGAPLKIGQSLFEVAPLKQMVCDVGVPEADISLVQANMLVTVRLEAYPDQELEGTLRTVHPQAELRDDTSVFVAEVELDNEAGLLRPGMNGKAFVHAGRRSLGWVLFHEPWRKVRRALAW